MTGEGFAPSAYGYTAGQRDYSRDGWSWVPGYGWMQRGLSYMAAGQVNTGTPAASSPGMSLMSAVLGLAITGGIVYGASYYGAKRARGR